MRGTAGAAGERGPAGFDGAKGIRGQAGAPGLSGPRGAPGADAEIDMAALEALVANLLREELDLLRAPNCQQLAGSDEICANCNVVQKAPVARQRPAPIVRVPEVVRRVEPPVVVPVQAAKAEMDIIFLIDGSNSIQESQWRDVRRWVVNFLRNCWEIF